MSSLAKRVIEIESVVMSSEESDSVEAARPEELRLLEPA